MKTKCVRLYGQNDLRLGTVELPEIKDDEILVKVISDSICMSSYKAAMQGSNHKRVPDDIAENPVIIGHEFCGEIVKVGSRWADQFKAGEKFGIQPAIDYYGTLLHHISSNEVRAAVGCNYDVSLATFLLESLGMAVTYSHRRVTILLLHHQLCHRLAYDVASAENNTFLARRLDIITLKQCQYAERCG